MSRNAPPERHLSPEFEMVLQQIRKLPDGSIVELRDGAEIETDYEAGVRRVRLVRGEAHFRVEKDPDRPFVVQARDLEIRAVGTAFAIQLERSSVEVVVTEGRVAVDPVDEQVAAGRDTAAVPTIVDAGNRVIVDTIGLVPRARAIEPMTNDAIRDRLAWRPSRLEFNGLELAEALELLNRTNRLQIKVNSPSVGRLRVSGTFHSDNPEGFARIVEATFGLKADVRSPYEIVLRQP
jgi:transmembrane sensor